MLRESKVCVFSYGEIGYNLLCFVCNHDKKINLVFLRKSDDNLEEKIKICKESNTSFEVIESISDPKCVKFFESEDIDLVFLLWWPDIVPERIIDKIKTGIVNLHPSYLPYNRGMHPYYWSIVDKTPAGVSLHFIDEKIDAGHIISQEKIKTDVTFTGEKLYQVASKKIINLFRKNYADILAGNISTKPVDIEQGTFHLKKDLDKHSEIVLDRKYKAEELLDIMRARTFNSKPSSYFYKGGIKYYVRVQIEKSP